MGFAGWDEFWGFVRGRVEDSVAALVERLRGSGWDFRALDVGLFSKPIYHVRGRVEVSVAALVERLLVLGLLVPPFYLHYRDPVLRCILNLQCVIAGWVVGYLGIRYGLRNPHRKDPLLFHG
jgi:hypothetical protein